MTGRDAITLGILAGGRGQRLGGRDKAWVRHRGAPLVENILMAFPGAFAERLVSARADDPRFGRLGLRVVLDRREDFAGPLAAIEALAAACTTPWLLTVPVDLDRLPEGLTETLAAAVEDDGVVVTDAEGLQPLLGLWRCAALREHAGHMLDAGESAARRLVARLRVARLDLSPRRLQNLNSPHDFPEGYDP
ncbi:MAG TPA: NTP transferase domain-containing protein [Arenimonas sp.]|uniref:NTP transferase domain-containing protein n=1 Tax=Arenimonas sp. TaxID=1872635 RepID=UPI002D7ED2E1|nr:NTP transferase domain-containing protein [Arenimonas sp.]HEU0153622.1 NTP transferase domain-containing protein [Arenimonas sp.]